MGILIMNEPNEHPPPAFRCSFWVISGLMDSPGQGHTQNEQLIRPHRLCQGLGRGPEPRFPDCGTRGRRMHHDPHRDPRRRHPHRSSRARDHPRFHPSGRDAGGHAHRPAGWRAPCTIFRSSSRHSSTRAPILPLLNSPWTPRPLPARRSSTCSAFLPSSKPICAASARPKALSRRSGVAPIAVVQRLFYPLLNDIGRFVWVCRC